MVGEVALLALVTAIVPIAACPPELALDIVAEHHPPAVRSSYSLGQIREFAARMGRPAKHEPFGFYASTFGYVVDVAPVAPAIKGCKPAVTARVRLVLGGRLIEVGSDIQNRHCQRDVILSHYMLHAQYDDKALSAYANRAMDALGQMPTAELLGGSPVPGTAVDAATEAIRHAMDKVLLSYERDRAEALTLADSPEELNRLAGACMRAL